MKYSILNYDDEEILCCEQHDFFCFYFTIWLFVQYAISMHTLRFSFLFFFCSDATRQLNECYYFWRYENRMRKFESGEDFESCTVHL